MSKELHDLCIDTAQIYKRLLQLNTPYHFTDLQRKHLYDDYIETMEYCRAILYSSVNCKLFQREKFEKIEHPVLSPELEDYLIQEEQILYAKKCLRR